MHEPDSQEGGVGMDLFSQVSVLLVLVALVLLAAGKT
jgi:hypothetical protein